MKLLLIILLILIAAAVLFIFALQIFSTSTHAQTYEQARKWQEDHYDLSWYDPLPKTDYTVKSYDGYILHVQFIENPLKTKRFILISHGYTDNHIGSLKYTKMYLDLGFNVILYDLRGHGINKKTFCTFSVRESRDLIELIRDSQKRYPDAEVFGIHGESLGSATSIACLKYKPDIDFVIDDCGFSEIESVMKNGLRGMHLPSWLIYPVSLSNKICHGLFFREMRPIDSLADNTIPILFIHGADDDFIFPFHSEHMQKATRGYSEIHLIPGAGHAASVLTAPDDYRKYVSSFLQTIGILP